MFFKADISDKRFVSRIYKEFKLNNKNTNLGKDKGLDANSQKAHEMMLGITNH